MLNITAAGITTRFVHDSDKGPRIVAKGFGKQRTVPYDHSTSSDRNHGLAAGALALGVKIAWDDSIIHDGPRADGSHKFVFPG